MSSNPRLLVVIRGAALELGKAAELLSRYFFSGADGDEIFAYDHDWSARAQRLEQKFLGKPSLADFLALLQEIASGQPG